MKPEGMFDGEGCLVAPAVTGAQIKAYREELRMTPEAFAQEFDIPLDDLRCWEGDTEVECHSFLQVLLARFPAFQTHHASA